MRDALADKDIALRIYKELSQYFLSEHMQAELFRKQVKEEKNDIGSIADKGLQECCDGIV